MNYNSESKKIVIILGNSNAGKDYIASTLYSEFYNFKFNQAFKDRFEKAHYLRPGTCNDKSKRGKLLLTGPYKKMTIGDAMVLAYKESEQGSGWGAQFKDLTYNSAEEFFSSTTKKLVVVTDLRKISEALLLADLHAEDLWEVSSVHVTSLAATPRPSDENLPTLLRMFPPDETIVNNY